MVGDLVRVFREYIFLGCLTLSRTIHTHTSQMYTAVWRYVRVLMCVDVGACNQSGCYVYVSPPKPHSHTHCHVLPSLLMDGGVHAALRQAASPHPCSQGPMFSGFLFASCVQGFVWEALDCLVWSLEFWGGVVCCCCCCHISFIWCGVYRSAVKVPTCNILPPPPQYPHLHKVLGPLGRAPSR